MVCCPCYKANVTVTYKVSLDGNKGFFPSSYFKKIEKTPEKTTQSSKQTNKTVGQDPESQRKAAEKAALTKRRNEVIEQLKGETIDFISVLKKLCTSLQASSSLFGKSLSTTNEWIEKLQIEETRVTKLEYNISFVGCMKAGKSTLVNSKSFSGYCQLNLKFKYNHSRYCRDEFNAKAS